MEHSRHFEPPQGQDGAGVPNLQTLFVLFREQLWLPIFCALLGFAAAVYYIQHRPPSYTASAVLQLEPRNRFLNFETESAPSSTSESSTQTTLELFRSRTLLQDAVTEMGLLGNPDFADPTLSQEQTTEALADSFQIKQRRGTQLLDVTARHKNAEMALKIANGITEAFLRVDEKHRSESVHSVLNFLLAEGERLKSRLQKSEEALQRYRETNNAVSLEEKQDTVTAALKNQANNLGAARSNRIRLETDAADMERFHSNPDKLLTIASIAQHPAITPQRTQINELLSRISTLNLRYTEKHPKLIQAKQQLADAETTLRRLTLQIPETLHADLERAIATERNFEKALQEQEKQSLSLNRQSISYQALVRDVETDRGLYQSILRRLKEGDIEKGIPLQSVRILEAATLPTSADPNKRLRLTALGLSGGLLAGTAFVLAGYFLNAVWRSMEEIEDATGLPVLASIPKQCGFQNEQTTSRLLQASQQITLEAFRSLRTALHVHARRNGKSCFLFTSALPDEGKSFCSTGYAMTLALQGVRVLLIDADLRKPFLAKHLLGNDQLPGLIDVLEGQIELHSAILPTKTVGLDLLPAGRVVSDASELLTQTGIDTILSVCRGCYDCVIIDCAPVLPVSDALLLSSAVDAVCMVVRYNVTPKNAFLRALHLLSEAGAPLEGIIFNAVSQSTLPKYYGHNPLKLPHTTLVRL